MADVGSNRPGWQTCLRRTVEQFETAWRDTAAGKNTPRIEDYLRFAGDSGSRRAQLVEALLKVELVFRIATRAKPSDSEYKERLPGYEAEIDAALAEVLSTVDWHGSANGAPARETVPNRIGRYEVIRLVGEGAFGRVYLAKDHLKRNVAIKVPRPDRALPVDLEQVLGEARMATLEHPGFVQIHNVESVDIAIPGQDSLYTTPVIIMEYVEQTLQAWQNTQRTFDSQAHLVAKVAEALQHLHEKEKYHRDLKPTNILIAPDNSPKIADFGLAVDETTERSRAGRPGGTPEYMSPEQVRQWGGEKIRIHGGADIWSLGVILYELLTTKRPFVGGSKENIFDQVLNDEVVPPRQRNQDIPPALEAICLKCLQKLPADRYRSAGELGADLWSYLAGDIPEASFPVVITDYARELRERLGSEGIAIGTTHMRIDALPRLFPTLEGDLRKALTASKLLAVVGDAGAGKSVALKQAALSACTRFLGNGDAPVPVWLGAVDFEGTLRVGDSLDSDIVAQGKQLAGPYGTQFLQKMLEHGRCWVFLDGLDELSIECGNSVQTAINRFARGSNRIIVGTRQTDLPRDWSGAVVAVPQLTADGRTRLAESISPGNGRKFENWLHDAPHEFDDLAKIPFFVPLLVELFLDPRFGIPRQPGRVMKRLFAKRVRTDLETHRSAASWRPWKHWKDDQVVEACRQVFGRMALGTLIHGGDLILGGEMALHSLDEPVYMGGRYVRLPQCDLDAPGETLIDAGVRMNLFKPGRRGLDFSHEIWRAYLAAQEVLRRDRSGAGSVLDIISLTDSHARPLSPAGQHLAATGIAHLQSQGGHEAAPEIPIGQRFAPPPLPLVVVRPWQLLFVMYSGLLGDFQDGEASSGFTRIASFAHGEPSDETDQWMERLLENGWLALAALGIVAGGAEVRSVVPRLYEAFVAELNRSEHDALHRLLFLRAIQHLGDRRIWRDPDESSCRPVPKQIAIPAGEFRIGLAADDCFRLARLGIKPKEFEVNYPAKSEQLSAFFISKYPVTNSQFAQFADADGVKGGGAGYREPRYWIDDDDSSGWDWLQDWQRRNPGKQRQPDGWSLPWFNQPSFPVVGITYYEAKAYCRWLSLVKSEQDRGHIYGLPTVDQWQAAARGPAGRFYPWGNETDPTRCNCWAADFLGVTTPVGLYPQKLGATPEGVEDMAGNVAEFCLATDENLVPICGGSWGKPLRRATDARFVAPDGTSNEVGFRIVMVSSK